MVFGSLRGESSGEFRGRPSNSDSEKRISLDKFRLNAPDVDDYDDDDDGDDQSSNLRDSSSNLASSAAAKAASRLASTPNSSMTSGGRARASNMGRSSFAWMGDDIENPTKGLFRKVRNSNTSKGQSADGKPLKSAMSNSFHGGPKSPLDPSNMPPRDEATQPADVTSTTNNANTVKFSQKQGSTEMAQIQQQLDDAGLTVAKARRQSKLKLCAIITAAFMCVLTLGLSIAAIVVIVRYGGEDNNNSNNNENENEVVPTTTQPPVEGSTTLAPIADSGSGGSVHSETLSTIMNRGHLKCGIRPEFVFAKQDETTEEFSGFDVDLCRAIAAGIFGSNSGEFFEFVLVNSFNRFIALQDEEFDVLIAKTTYTMQRNVLEPTSGARFAFSVPYIYDRMRFAGLPQYIDCVNELSTTGVCEDLQICVLEGTTHSNIVRNIMPDASVASVLFGEQLHASFINGECNVMTGEQYDVAEEILQLRGYQGEYAQSNSTYSEEPLSMVTNSGDIAFSDFVNWILQGLFTAEDNGITQDTASRMGTTGAFGKDFENMFIYAVGAVGSYAEMFERNLAPFSPRSEANQLNGGSTGLIFPLPFGKIDILGTPPPANDILEVIRTRGTLRCGVSKRPFFANFDELTQSWTGFDVDFCRAISAALFGGDPNQVTYSDLGASERFIALKNREVDVLARLTTHTLDRDIEEPTAQTGLAFSQPIFYDGLTFGGIPAFVLCADSSDVTSFSCRDLKICAVRDTTFDNILVELFGDDSIVLSPTLEDVVQGLSNGDCNVMAGGVVDVYEPAVLEMGYTGPYRSGLNRFSRDPLALVTREDDVLWSRFVFWVAMSTFYAESMGITVESASSMPKVFMFGSDYVTMFQNAIGAVGSYADIFERNAKDDIPRGGQNLFNEMLNNPQILPLPGIL